MRPGPGDLDRAGQTKEECEGPSDGVVALRPHLFLLLEAERPSAGGARFALTGVDEVLIGRGEAREAKREVREGKTRLVVRVPGGWMSATHARIVRAGGAWVLEDAGSRNGISVGGARIERCTLRDGDVFEAGRSFFLVRDALPTPPGSREHLDASELAHRTPGLRTLVPGLAASLSQLTAVAESKIPLLLLGETGTGKEVLARSVHRLSTRPGAFVAVNCGGISPALVEGLLFGHVRGSFSGATRDEIGFVRAADRGTLFLDEIGDFPLSAQPSLLRILQEHEVVPVGSAKPVSLDLRVVAATHRDLDAQASSGTFRSDLLMRLDGFRHRLPALRDRREDIGVVLADLLAKHADGRLVTFTSAGARAMLGHPWPGNMRELAQVLERALVLAAGQPVDGRHLALDRASVEPPGGPSLSDEDAKLRAMVIEALTQYNGNVTEVARALGKARTQVQRWMRRFAIDGETYRRSK